MVDGQSWYSFNGLVHDHRASSPSPWFSRELAHRKLVTPPDPALNPTIGFPWLVMNPNKDRAFIYWYGTTIHHYCFFYHPRLLRLLTTINAYDPLDYMFHHHSPSLAIIGKTIGSTMTSFTWMILLTVPSAAYDLSSAATRTVNKSQNHVTGFDHCRRSAIQKRWFRQERTAVARRVEIQGLNSPYCDTAIFSL